MRCKSWKETMITILCLCLALTGCSTANVESSESLVSSETSMTTETAIPTETETSVEETEPTTDENVFRTELYYQYLQNELIPQYGVYDINADVITNTYADKLYTPANSALKLSTGIVGVEVADFNQDEKAEMLVAYVTPFLSDMEEGKKVQLHLYSIDDSNAVVLKDDQDLLHITDYGFQRIFDEISVVENTDGAKYIMLYKSMEYDGTTQQVVVLRITEDTEFQLCELFIDPGYTSGVGLYYTNSLPVADIAGAMYNVCDEIFHADYFSGDAVNLDGYFNPLSEKLTPYGIAITHDEGTVFSLSANPETILFSLSLKADRNAGTSTIHVTGNLPPEFGVSVNQDAIEQSNTGNISASQSTNVQTDASPHTTLSITPSACNRTGEIKGSDVAGFTTDYVCNNGAVGYVRRTLEDKWHITAKQCCQSKGLTWYEVYDTNDGDYYGWVDGNFITFYDENVQPTVAASTTERSVSNWKDAYRMALDNFRDSARYESDSMWDLVDVDCDGTPELFISEGFAMVCGVYLYYYDGASAVEMDSDGNGIADMFGSMGVISVLPEESLILSGYYNHGIESSIIFRYSNHSVIEVGSFYNDEDAYEEAGNYEVNGVAVTAVEYQAAIDEHYSKNWVTVGQKYGFDDYSVLN